MNKFSFRPLLLGIFFLYTQAFFADNFVLWSIIPNFLIPFTIFINIKYPLNVTAGIILFIGLCIDLLEPTTLGLNTFLLSIIGFLVNRYNSAINKKFIGISISVLALNVLYYLSLFVFQYSFAQMSSNFLFHIIIAIIYNSVLSLLILSVLLILRYLKIEIKI